MSMVDEDIHVLVQHLHLEDVEDEDLENNRYTSEIRYDLYYSRNTIDII
jgi:hypothetical protein